MDGGDGGEGNRNDPSSEFTAIDVGGIRIRDADFVEHERVIFHHLDRRGVGRFDLRIRPDLSIDLELNTLPTAAPIVGHLAAARDLFHTCFRPLPTGTASDARVEYLSQLFVCLHFLGFGIVTGNEKSFERFQAYFPSMKEAVADVFDDDFAKCVMSFLRVNVSR